MNQRKLNVSSGAGGLTGVKRARFDSHVDRCKDCQPVLCPMAQQLWRAVCVQAMRSQGGSK
jgi:hypothetical protein